MGYSGKADECWMLSDDISEFKIQKQQNLFMCSFACVFAYKQRITLLNKKKTLKKCIQWHKYTECIVVIDVINNYWLLIINNYCN